MDGWSAKVSRQAICLLELMTQRLRDRKPLYCPWWLSTDQAHSLMGTETFRLCSPSSVLTHIHTSQLAQKWFSCCMFSGKYWKLSIFTSEQNCCFFVGQTRYTGPQLGYIRCTIIPGERSITPTLFRPAWNPVHATAYVVMQLSLSW